MDATLFEIIRRSELFSDLNDEELKNLLDLVQIVELHATQVLFEQNDDSDSVYLLLQGDLVASRASSIGETKILGYVRAGEIVGEMGLISSQPRSLTISALNDAKLIKLTRHVFEQYFENRPQPLLHILSIVINRAQNTLHSLTTIKRCIFIAVVPANVGDVVNMVFEKISAMLKNNVKVCLLSDKEIASYNTLESAKKLLDKLGRSNDYVIFRVDLNNEIATHLLLEKSHRVLIVAEENEKPELNKFIKQFMNNKAYDHIKKELVLIYNKPNATPQNTKQWLSQGNINQHYHIRMRDEDYNYLLRFLVGQPIGLVLSGGGTKGWVHVGAIKALHEAQLPIDAVGGTSIGAIVGGAYLLHQDYMGLLDAIHEFANVAQSMVNFRQFTYPLISLLDGKKKIVGLYKVFNGVQIEDLCRPYFSICANLSDNSEVVNSEDSLWLWASASSSLPGLVPPITHEGKIYLDGGVVNSLPVDVMKNVVGEKGKIIAVDLSLHLKSNEGYSFPPVITFMDALLYKLKYKNYKQFKFPSFAATLLESLMMGSQAKTERNILLADVVVRPDLSKYRMISNLPEADELMEIGYKAMKEQLKEFLKDYH